MGLFQKFCEWGTDAKYVKPGKKCDLCGKKWATTPWSSEVESEVRQ